ncbi:translational activator for mitochondrial COX1 [Malassezia psittaci]|uniref:Translational activator for mitochondrial COX1 n=1 Tax=Malassezia psittaci TaxID=1821823 RepID=A0AAF0JJB7_9BASI|nr:translational activator for mitochondrial COX1 [Malassezia psittaci]
MRSFTLAAPMLAMRGTMPINRLGTAVHTRSLFGLFKQRSATKKPDPTARPPILEEDDLFHKLSESPIPAMRARGERIRTLAPCPVSMSKYGIRRLVNFECPDCGWPTHYSHEMWLEDPDHAQYVPRLREANEDEHDLRSGRPMTEFQLPRDQPSEEVVNLSGWDQLFYTRNFPSIDSERSKRHVSKLLTFPMTVVGALHENSPYTRRSTRLTHEGLRSLAPLRKTMHPELGAKPNLDPVRIFVVGARAEATLPPEVWRQIEYNFPKAPIHVIMIGPEAPIQPKTMSGSWNSPSYKERAVNFPFPARSIAVSPGLTITVIQATYERVHPFMEPFDPYTDAFFAFAPGFGFPSEIAVEETARLRAEEREDERKMKAARETFYAKHAPVSDETMESVPNSGYRPSEVAKNPAGGDTPAAEPDPEVMAFRPKQGQFTAVQTAPIVQAQREWAQSLGQILSTRCPLFISGFSPADVERDVLAFESVDGVSGEFDWLLTPGENAFSSQQWAIADFDTRIAVKANWGLWAVRGKRYDILGPQWE